MIRKPLLVLALIQAIIPLGPVIPATLPTLSVPTAIQCTEGGSASIKVTRSGSKTTTASFRYATANGTAVAPADYTAASGNQSVRKNALTYTLTVKCRAENKTYQPTGTFTLTITATSGATIAQGKATISVVDNDPVPPPPPPAEVWAFCSNEGEFCKFIGVGKIRYGAGSSWVTRPWGQTPSDDNTVRCSNDLFGDPAVGVVKRCEVTGVTVLPTVPPDQPPPVVCPDGTVIKMGEDCPMPPPPPPPANANWVPAPLKVGGYGYLVNGGPCCNGLIVLVTRAVMSDDADPNLRHLIYYGRFVADPSGNFPGIDPTNYWATKELGGWGEGPLVNGGGGLIGVAPVAVPPATGMRPTYGDTVQALAACTGQTDPAPLIVGARYIVKGLRATVPIATNATPMNLPDTVVLNPEVDDGLHRGDGWWGLTVPASCVQRV